MINSNNVFTLTEADVADMILSYSEEALDYLLKSVNGQVRAMIERMQELPKEELVRHASLRDECEAFSFESILIEEFEKDELIELEEPDQ